MVKKFDNDRYADHAQGTTDQASLFQSQLGRTSKVTAKNCPLVWDTGASFGLTPFLQDFIDYVECEIPVKDISKTNIVIGIGTMLNRFYMDGEPVFLPCLSYHLPLTEVRLFSPQVYHTLYGGHSTVSGDHVTKFIDNMEIRITIDREGSNVPTIMGLGVSAKDMATV